MLHSTGQSEVYASVYAPAMIELAVGEVHEPQDAEDEADADGHQRVGRAEADRVDDHLGVDRRERECARARSREVGRDHRVGVVRVGGRHA